MDSAGLDEFTFGNEKWLHGNLNNLGNPWYFVLPNGDLYAWNGKAGLKGTLLLNVGSNGWENPELIVDAATLTAAFAAQVQAADQARGFYRSSSGNYFLRAFGLGEKWIEGLSTAKLPADQNNPWYFIKPDGTVWEWDGTGGLHGTQVLSISADVNLYKDPSLLYNAFQDASVNSAGWDQQRHFYFDASQGLAQSVRE